MRTKIWTKVGDAVFGLCPMRGGGALVQRIYDSVVGINYITEKIVIAYGDCLIGDILAEV